MSWKSRAAVFLALLALDRLTKWWALERLSPRGSIPVLPFFHLTYVENTGAAFGMGRGMNAFFIVLSASLTAVLFYLMRVWDKKGPWVRWGLILVAAGAVGNLYDRLAYRFVVDFLDFRAWPVFNAADSCVTVGACCLAWGLRHE